MGTVVALLLCVVAVMIYLFWLLTLYRAASNHVITSMERGRWVVIIAIFYVFGAFAYLYAMKAMAKHAADMEAGRASRG